MFHELFECSDGKVYGFCRIIRKIRISSHDITGTQDAKEGFVLSMIGWHRRLVTIHGRLLG